MRRKAASLPATSQPRCVLCSQGPGIPNTQVLKSSRLLMPCCFLYHGHARPVLSVKSKRLLLFIQGFVLMILAQIYRPLFAVLRVFLRSGPHFAFGRFHNRNMDRRKSPRSFFRYCRRRCKPG